MSSKEPLIVQKKRVLIVGAGAAGMSCADQLSKSPEKFEVTIVDAQDYCGGQAFSIGIDKEKFGAEWLNQGVQGGSYIFRHTFRMFEQQGFKADPVKLQVSFGKGDQFWTNVFPTKMVQKHASEIKRFTLLLKFIRWFEVFFVFMPIKVLMKLFMFSTEFTEYMILPTIALFLGTGNATPEVSSVILERLFTSPTYGMWYPADKDSLASNHPPMCVFPKFSDFYETWRQSLVRAGVNVRLSTELTGVIERTSSGVKVGIKPRTPQPDHHNPVGGDPDAPETIEDYDEIVLCVLADTAKRLLGKNATMREKFVLGSTKWSDDVTVTHWDDTYMQNHYTNTYDPDQAIRTLNGKDQSLRNERGGSFAPMYYIKPYPEDPSKLEMCFDCTNYQSQFPRVSNPADPPSGLEVSRLPLNRHVFQTIFLNKDRDSPLWTMDQINKDKIIRIDWWHQLCHSWTHYLFVVPWMWALNGRQHTRYGAAWTLVNAHELAVISGLAAAWSLGGGYPEEMWHDGKEAGRVEPEREERKGRWEGFAVLCFRLYCLLAYGRWYSKGS
ncbi:hypothetical protein YB2330_002934 [Saitoella coloradoensis]